MGWASSGESPLEHPIQCLHPSECNVPILIIRSGLDRLPALVHQDSQVVPLEVVQDGFQRIACVTILNVYVMGGDAALGTGQQ